MLEAFMHLLCISLNGKLPAGNMLIQLSAIYTDPESYNAQRSRRTDGRHDDANSRSYCLAVPSAKTLSQSFILNK